MPGAAIGLGGYFSKPSGPFENFDHPCSAVGIHLLSQGITADIFDRYLGHPVALDPVKDETNILVTVAQTYLAQHCLGMRPEEILPKPDRGLHILLTDGLRLQVADDAVKAGTAGVALDNGPRHIGQRPCEAKHVGFAFDEPLSFTTSKTAFSGIGPFTEILKEPDNIIRQPEI